MTTMLSEAARRQQVGHHHSGTYPNYGVDYKPASNLSFLQSPPSDQMRTVKYASFRQRLERPQQHTQPVLGKSSPRTRLLSVDSPGIDTIPSEHMLRRKTPNGTLAAGYDGSSGEWNTRPHASKHFLLHPSNTPSNTTGLLLQQDSALEGQQNTSHLGQSPFGLQYRNAGAVENLKLDPGWSQNLMSAADFDSVLNQSNLQSQAYRLASDPQVPIALQPMWPPCLGFTPIHNPGPVGPYWPNGVYEPYRPAAQRDPRYPPNDAGIEGTASPPTDQTNFNYNIWLQEYDEPHHVGIDRRLPQTPFLENAGNASFSSKDFANAPEGSIAAFNGNQDNTHHRYGAPIAYRQKDYSWKEQHPSSLTSAYSNLRVSSLDLPQPDQSVNLKTVQNNGQFKEKVLVWAHGIYGTLLACIEQARRNSNTEQQAGHHHSNHCPQPPRRPYPSWSHSHTPTNLPDALTGSSLHIPDNTRESSQFSSNPYQLPALRTGNVTGTQVLQEMHTTVSNQDIWAINSRSASNLAQASYVPFQIAQAQCPSNPPAAATHAIEILSRLCEESNWTWIDGMLLSGCLAYGLSDYDKAMKWYLKVLQCNPNNVEAMSNLAATLILFDRRQEAEQYWVRSVKLRPSYFEAVEHLVGLLHESQRGREAVRLVEYVEHALRHQSPRTTMHFNSRSHPQISKLSGYAIPPSDNGRMLALIHGKGNVLYQMGDNNGAARAFENAILIGAGTPNMGIRSLIKKILSSFSDDLQRRAPNSQTSFGVDEPLLLPPEMALETSRHVFAPHGRLPGLEEVSAGISQKAAISIVSNSLLSLAKIYQDAMSSSGASAMAPRATSGVQEILALYYLSLSLQPSPSTANNVGILLAGVQQSARMKADANSTQTSSVPGVVPGSGVALALAYYDYGLKLDSRHAHLYTNLGSLFKDIGQLNAAIRMYEKAVEYDGNFDIALANLANAVKDKGEIGEAIKYYRRAVTSNPDFAEAVCGLANALNSVCKWDGRGGVHPRGGIQDRWHVDEHGVLYDSKQAATVSCGWIERVVVIVEKQLLDGQNWGKQILQSVGIDNLMLQLSQVFDHNKGQHQNSQVVRKALVTWSDESWEGAKVVRLIERATRRLSWQVYKEKYVDQRPVRSSLPMRPQLPAALAIPGAPTVLPFHTFTCPLSAKQIRRISQRNGLRVSCSTLRAPWLPHQVYEPPSPPNPHIIVGYVSSDFNNHPLAHLMQSVFGLHDQCRVKAICYATTASDGSIHRHQIENEAPMFHDASSWSVERLVSQVIADGVHILVNLNGYTRGAKNEVFAARPAPIQMSFMGFAGTLGAEWCDYLLADQIAVPPQTLRPWRSNVDLVDQTQDSNNQEDQQDDWVYGENIIYTRDTFFCCDHRQSAPDAHGTQLTWVDEQQRRWKMRKMLFPDLEDDAVILGNFNQLYKIEPTTFRLWLRILSRVPKAVLWLLRFPDLGEKNLRQTALLWVGQEVASRIIFTDVAPKHQHISRATICDLFLDTPECNAHTTAADVLWSGTPLLTFPRYDYKMCSRMAASILKGALPKSPEGIRAFQDLVVGSNESYEEQGVELAGDLVYRIENGMAGIGQGRLVELRKLLYESRWTSALFDTTRWVRDLETAYDQAWRKWVAGEGGDIWL